MDIWLKKGLSAALQQQQTFWTNLFCHKTYQDLDQPPILNSTVS